MHGVVLCRRDPRPLGEALEEPFVCAVSDCCIAYSTWRVMPTMENRAAVLFAIFVCLMTAIFVCSALVRCLPNRYMWLWHEVPLSLFLKSLDPHPMDHPRDELLTHWPESARFEDYPRRGIWIVKGSDQATRRRHQRASLLRHHLGRQILAMVVVVRTTLLQERVNWSSG